MKEGWKYKRLGEVGTFTRGGNFTKGDFVNGGIPCIHYGQIHMHFGVTTEEPLTYLPVDFPKLKYAQKGDLIIAITSEDDEGSCKCTAWLGDNKVAVGGHIAVYRHELNPKYVSYFFRSPQFYRQKLQYTHGFKVVEIKPSDIASISIPVPPLPEQQRIVELLDAEFAKIDVIKANAEQQLQAAKDLFQAALRDLLTPKEGWHIVKIGDLFKTYAGGTPLSSKKEYYTNGNIPWINSGEVCQKYIETTKNFITELGLNNSSAKYYPANTVLIALYGATAAQSGILKFEATSNQAVCGLLPNEKMLPEFVYYWFVLNKMKFSAMAQGGAQPNLSQIKVKAMHIPEIPLKEQTIICDKLSMIEEKVQQLQANYDQTITLCNDLKQSLLKSIFE